MSNLSTLTLHPFYFGPDVSAVTFEPLTRLGICTVAQRGFGVNVGVGQDVQYTMTQAQMRTAVEAKVTSYGWGGESRKAYYDWEACYNDSANWTQAKMIDMHTACQLAAPTFQWMPYFFPRVSMNITGAGAELTALQASNDAQATFYAALDLGDAVMPDFYLQPTSTLATIAASVPINATEVTRIRDLTAVTATIPMIATILNGGANCPGNQMALLLRLLEAAGYSNVGIWGNLTDATDVANYNAVISATAISWYSDLAGISATRKRRTRRRARA